MTDALHADAVSRLSAWSPSTAALKVLRERYLTHLQSYADALTRPCYPAHLTASSLVLSADGSRALLTLHAKAQAWFQLGGHCEPGDLTLAAAALREATEESGIAGLAIDPLPFYADDHAVPFCAASQGQAAPVRHYDVWFVVTAPEGAAFERSEESLSLKWWPLSDLPGGEPVWGPALQALRERQRQRR